MSISNNTTKLQSLMDKINALPDYKEGIELPELSNEGSSANLLNNKQLIDSEGNIVTGSMPDRSNYTLFFDGIDTKSIILPEGYYINGTVSLNNEIDDEVETQADLIAQIQTAVDGLPEVGDGSGVINTCTGSITVAKWGMDVPICYVDGDGNVCQQTFEERTTSTITVMKGSLLVITDYDRSKNIVDGITRVFAPSTAYTALGSHVYFVDADFTVKGM